MQKSWYWLLLFIILVSSCAYIWFKNPILQVSILQKIAPSLVTKGDIPQELSENFDPTVNQSTFELIQNLDGESLELKQVFPPNYNGNLYTSSLVCNGGVNIKYSNQTKYAKSSLQEVMSLLTLENGPILITGYCNNNECTEITSKCDIYISGK